MEIAKKWIAVLLVGVSLLSSASAAEIGGWEAASATQQERLLASMGAQLRVMLGNKPLHGQVFPAAIRVAVSGTDVSVELGMGFIPIGSKDFTPELQRQLQELNEGVMYQAESIGLHMTSIRYTFDGKKISEIFPDDFAGLRSGPTR